jgi:hypothetical protein
MNAMGFNTQDGYLYAMGSAILALAAGLVRIDADGVTTEVDSNPPRTLALGTYDVGDVDDQGQYWATNGGIDWLKYDLNPTSPTYGQATFGSINLLNLLSISIGDWSFVQSGGGLYALGAVGTVTALYRFDRTTRAITKVAEYPNGPSFTTVVLLVTVARAPVWSATYSGQGLLYASESVSGQIWRFPITGGTPTRVSNTAVGPTGLADGARCFSAPNV